MLSMMLIIGFASCSKKSSSKKGSKATGWNIDSKKAAAKTKQEAVDYYNTNGTLKGFKGKLYNSTSDFLNEYNTKLKAMNLNITEKEFQKLRNKFENQFVNSNSSVEGIASSLATFYMLYDDINLINSEIEIYNSITREEIREIANKYLKPNQRLVLDYLPKKDKE